MERAQRVDFANTLRGLAAFCVVVSHYYGVFWTSRAVISGLTNTPELSIIDAGIPIYITWINALPFIGWGPFGVALFFLISGFVIPFSLRRSTGIAFLFQRMIRIYPVYFAGFSITLAGIYCGSLYYGRPWSLPAEQILKHIPGLRDILWSPSIDGIIWTLEIEMKFYVVCAICASLFRNRSTLIFCVPLLLFVTTCAIDQISPWLLVNHIEVFKQANNLAFAAPYLIFMFIGTSFHFAFRNWISMERSMLFSLVMFMGFAILMQIGPTPTLFSITWSYGFGVALFLFAYCYPALFKGTRLTDFFASISYPLYVLHGVAGYVGLRVLIGSGMRASVSLAIVTTSAVLLAWVVHVFVERPCQTAIERLKRADEDRRKQKMVLRATEPSRASVT